MKIHRFLVLFSCLFFSSLQLFCDESSANQKSMNTNDANKSCCQQPCFDECQEGPRGPRGHRGRRGHRGATGATGAASGCGVSEIWMNALQMAGCGEGPLWPPVESLSPYGGCTAIPVWNLGNPLVAGGGGWGAFNVPDDLDNSKPVTVVVHILVASTDGPPTGSLANIQVQTAYLANNVVGGITPPATGFSDTETSGDFTVTPPDIVSSNNVTQISVPVVMDASLLVPGDWGFISVVRVPASTDEYADTIWLSTLSIQYSRLCS